MKDNLGLVQIKDFVPELAILLPATHALLVSANLIVHPSVHRIVLHGSRGLAGGSRPDSDIDFSLIVGTPEGHISENMFAEITNITLGYWQAPVALDLAIIFDTKGCKLNCFEQTIWKKDLCQIGGIDCFGLYKTQTGYNGIVTNAGIQVRLMYPCLKIWQREEESE